MLLDSKIIIVFFLSLLFLGGCKELNIKELVSNNAIEVEIKKEAIIPLGKRAIHIEPIHLDNIDLKISLQAALLNSKIATRNYYTFVPQEKAQTLLSVDILENEFEYFKYNNPKESKIPCNIVNYKLKILHTTKDALTNVYFNSEVFKALKQFKECSLVTQSVKDELIKHATDEIIDNIVKAITPKILQSQIIPSQKGIEAYSKEDVELFNEGLELLNKKEFFKAKDRFLLLSYRKNDYSVNFNLALSYEKINDFPQALKYYKLASMQHLDSAEINQALLHHDRLLNYME